MIGYIHLSIFITKSIILLALTHQPELGYHQCIDESILELHPLYGSLANVIAAVAAVVSLQAVLEVAVGILPYVIYVILSTGLSVLCF